MGNEWVAGWGFAMMLFMGLFWIFVIAGAVWIAATLARRQGDGGESTRERAALRILEERLARGDVDVEEFKARKAAIEAGR